MIGVAEIAKENDMKKDMFTQIKDQILEDCESFDIPKPIEIREATFDENDNLTNPPALLVVKPDLEGDAKEQARLTETVVLPTPPLPL